jgi:hypothetical protein
VTASCNRGVQPVAVALDQRSPALHMVQFFPCLALPLLFMLFSPKYSGTFYWVIAAVLYTLAKLLEFYDGAIYSARSILSGHTLKHFAAAAACFAVLRYFQTRRSIAYPVTTRSSLQGGVKVDADDTYH